MTIDDNTSQEVAPLRAEKTLGEKIDDLHSETFGGSKLGHHTDLWNEVFDFKEKVKKLVA